MEVLESRASSETSVPVAPAPSEPQLREFMGKIAGLMAAGLIGANVFANEQSSHESKEKSGPITTLEEWYKSEQIQQYVRKIEALGKTIKAAQNFRDRRKGLRELDALISVAYTEFNPLPIPIRRAIAAGGPELRHAANNMNERYGFRLSHTLPLTPEGGVTADVMVDYISRTTDVVEPYSRSLPIAPLQKLTMHTTERKRSTWRTLIEICEKAHCVPLSYPDSHIKKIYLVPLPPGMDPEIRPDHRRAVISIEAREELGISVKGSVPQIMTDCKLWSVCKMIEDNGRWEAIDPDEHVVLRIPNNSYVEGCLRQHDWKPIRSEDIPIGTVIQKLMAVDYEKFHPLSEWQKNMVP